MGDRATLKIRDGFDKETGKPEGVEIYTHWGGQQSLINALLTAIERAPDRMGDATYLTRVVVCALAEKDMKGTTGIGIWMIGSQENEYGEFLYDAAKQLITVGNKKFTPEEFKQWAKIGEKA